MARPRIFISSTFYDLRHIRYSLDTFIERLGYDSILSEKGDIAYLSDAPLDESCYREVENVDIFVLIVGGRYGSEVSNGNKKPKESFFERYESITKKEFETAFKKDIPTYILIEASVYAEHQTYLKNKDNDRINYAHVDSINVFVLLEEILSKPRNNPVKTFEKFDEIEDWLREQWAGLFRELLTRKSQQNQIKTLTTEVAQLQEINKTLKTYLEAVLSSVKPGDSSKLIEDEQKRLEDAARTNELRNNRFIEFVLRNSDLDFDTLLNLIQRAKTFKELFNSDFISSSVFLRETVDQAIRTSLSARNDLNAIRKTLNLDPFTDFPEKRTDQFGMKRVSPKNNLNG